MADYTNSNLYNNSSQKIHSMDYDKADKILYSNSNISAHEIEFLLSLLMREQNFSLSQKYLTGPELSLNSGAPIISNPGVSCGSHINNSSSGLSGNNKSRAAAILDCIFNRFINNPLEFDLHKKSLGKALYFSAFKNEVWFEQILYALLQFYIRMDSEKDEEIIKLFLLIINDYKIKLDIPKLRKFFNPEDNYIYVMLKNNNYCQTSFYKVIFFHEAIEKTFHMAENKEKCKNKHKRITLQALSTLKHPMIDYYLILISLKFKAEPNKLLKKDIEIEKNCIRLFMKNFESINAYFLNNFLLCFNSKENLNSRKSFLFVLIIVIRLGSISFITRLIKHLTASILQLNMSQYDFTILFEKHNYSFSILNSNGGFISCFETLITEIFYNEDEETNDYLRYCDKLNCVYALLEFFESLTSLKDVCLNFAVFYDFYYIIQKKIIQHVILPKMLKDANSLYRSDIISSSSEINNASYGVPFSQLKQEYFAKFQEYINIIQKFATFCKRSKFSLIFTNWFVLFYKDASFYVVYELIKSFLLSEKEGSIIFYLFVIKDEINKFFNDSWNILLNNLFDDFKSANETYHLILNLKYVFFYEVSIKNQTGYSSVIDSNGIIKSKDAFEVFNYFKKNFKNLSYLFIESANNSDCELAYSGTASQLLTGGNMDIDDQPKLNQTFQSSLVTRQSSFTNTLTNMPITGTSNTVQPTSDSFTSKSKAEVLNIFYIILNNYKEPEIISKDILEFVNYVVSSFICSNQKFYDFAKNISKCLTSISFSSNTAHRF